MVLYSPWVDLTLSFPSVNINAPCDLLHTTMLCTAAWGYTAAVRKHARDMETKPVKGSVHDLLLRHPLFSPALEFAMDSLKRVADWAVPEIFVVSVSCSDLRLEVALHHVADED